MRSSEVSSEQEPKQRGEVLRTQLSAKILFRIEKLAFKHGTDPNSLLEKAINLVEKDLSTRESLSEYVKDWGLGPEDLPDFDGDLTEMTDIDGPPVSVQIQALRKRDHETPGDIASDF